MSLLLLPHSTTIPQRQHSNIGVCTLSLSLKRSYAKCRRNSETRAVLSLQVTTVCDGGWHPLFIASEASHTSRASVTRVSAYSHCVRVRVAGFLSTGDSNAPGNYALLDIVAALHWVKENIGAFSGDAESVTLLGQGYGAALVHFLMVSPVTRGVLFRCCSSSPCVTIFTSL